jgi:hypothetical protein
MLADNIDYLLQNKRNIGRQVRVHVAPLASTCFPTCKPEGSVVIAHIQCARSIVGYIVVALYLTRRVFHIVAPLNARVVASAVIV